MAIKFYVSMFRTLQLLLQGRYPRRRFGAYRLAHSQSAFVYRQAMAG